MRLPAFNEQERALFAAASAVEEKDAYTATHPRRVARIALNLGIQLGLQDSDLLALFRGGLVHDIGKTFVPIAILRKPGPLNADEQMEMRTHSAVGERIVNRLSSATDLLSIVRHHHERFDGSGYPDGLRGNKIPLLARIMSVSDAHDALTSDRPYRARHHHEDAIEILIRGAGTQWDRGLVSLLLKQWRAPRLQIAS